MLENIQQANFFKINSQYPIPIAAGFNPARLGHLFQKTVGNVNAEPDSTAQDVDVQYLAVAMRIRQNKQNQNQ